MASPDNKGQAELSADTDGDGFIRVDGQYLRDALRACEGMVELKLTNAYSPMLFSQNSYQLVVMPMLTADSQKPEGETQTAEPEPEAEKTEAVAEAEAVVKAEKPKRSRKKEPVAVA